MGDGLRRLHGLFGRLGVRSWFGRLRLVGRRRFGCVEGVGAGDGGVGQRMVVVGVG